MVDATRHQLPPTFSEQARDHCVGNAKQVGLLPADYTRLSVGELRQRHRHLMTCSHVESLLTQQLTRRPLQKSVDTRLRRPVDKRSWRLTVEFNGQTRTIFTAAQRLAKNSFKSALHSDSRMPLRTSTR